MGGAQEEAGEAGVECVCVRREGRIPAEAITVRFETEETVGYRGRNRVVNGQREKDANVIRDGALH